MEVESTGLDIKELILFSYRDSLLPELFDFLGDKTAIQFIQLFGGVRLELPPYQEIIRLKRDIEIYETLCKVRPQRFSNHHPSVLALSDKYELAGVSIQKIYGEMTAKYKNIKRFVEKSRSASPVRLTTKRNPRKDLNETTGH